MNFSTNSLNVKLKIGLFINPIAGMGGKVALKGTDGYQILNKAIKLGAKPITPILLNEFLKELKQSLISKISFFVAPTPMGTQIFNNFPQIDVSTISIDLEDPTTAKDTKKVVEKLCRMNIDLIIFFGGDGTSVDVYEGLKRNIPVLGIPSGVKTYGEVFAHNLHEAIAIIEVFYRNRESHFASILDLDEQEYRTGQIKAKKLAQLPVPNYPQFFQVAKSSTNISVENEETYKSIAKYVFNKIKSLPADQPVIIGPGSTFNMLAKLLGVERSILGVDILYRMKLVLKDATEKQIVDFCSKVSPHHLPIVLVTPIGSMGYLFGRGNQQLTEILKKIPKRNIWIIASQEKLNRIQDGVLRIDTRNNEINKRLIGYYKVITDKDEYRMQKVVY